jgi:3-dehydroquinate synthase
MIVAMTRVPVNVQPRPYEAWIENGLLRRAGEVLRQVLPDRKRLFVVSVPPVRRVWGQPLLDALLAAGFSAELFEMRDGESHKTMSSVEDLANKLVKRGADRSCVILALGGGVVGDVSGFLAAVYMRGIDFVQIPTTFLAQVDASIGGKTGVNLRAGKNLVGSFHQPRAVLIDPAVLSTLPEREYRSGLYEALKCGVIGNAELFRFFEEQRSRVLSREITALEWLITESVKLKAAVVAEDERESGPRRVLNFGHTIGHALEAESGYKKFLHGEAVAWGMVAASMIAAGLQKAEAETARRIISTVLALAPLPKVDLASKKVSRRLQSDKKTRNGVVHFVLPVEIGKVEIVSDIPERAVLQAIEELRYLSQA